MVIKKQPLVRLDARQSAAGKKAWERASQKPGRITSSMDFERSAQKTWIRWMDATGNERAVIECELYMQPRVSGAAELVGMLHGMCPCCGETFLVREDNKEMSLGSVRYGRAPRWMRVHHRVHLAEKHGLRKNLALEDLHRLPLDEEMVRAPRDDDPIPLISGTNRVEEPWVCDYCKRWAVCVYENIARDYERNKDIIVNVGAGERSGGTRRPDSFEV